MIFVKKIIQLYNGYKVGYRSLFFFNWLQILVRNRWVGVGESGSQKVGRFLVRYGHRGSFYGMFSEIFIDQNYRIAPTAEPLVIIDAGTNIGMSLCYFSEMAPRATIVAFEPNPATYAIAKENIERNKLSVTLHNVGLGKDKKMMELFTDVSDVSSQSASLTKHIKSKGRDVTAVSVKIEPLSPYITGPVDILKLDIEGAEGEVMEELTQAGSLKHIKTIFMEYHFDGTHTTYPLCNILKMLDEAGFSYALFSPYRLPFPIPTSSKPLQSSYKITAWRKGVGDSI